MLTSQRLKSGLVNVVCTAAFLAFVCMSCGSDVPGVQNVDYFGMTADPSNVPGQISLQGISLATQVQALGSGSGVVLSGTYTRAGSAPITLDGFHDTGTGTIAFSGFDAAGTWSFLGDVSGTTASGASTTPVGTGSFILRIGATPTSVTIYCGTGTCSAGCSGSAGFNLAIGGSSAILAANFPDGVTSSAGTVSGSSVHFDITAGGLDGNIDGTISGSSISGTFDEATNGWLGTWNGSTAACTSVSVKR